MKFVGLYVLSSLFPLLTHSFLLLALPISLRLLPVSDSSTSSSFASFVRDSLSFFVFCV